MSRSLRPALAVALLVAAAALAACGTEGNQIASNSPDYQGSVLFEQHCSGCHTLAVVGTQGSSVNVATREYKDGPNFNVRKESAGDVLYAIQNGGFSSGPMPQDILTGGDAQKVADFIAKYSGKEAARPPEPRGTQ
jgi:mono/diheme cytochrome c family protein